MNDVTRRFRARPTINLVVTNNIGRLCWPPAQLSGHLDFFQNTCRYCKYRSAGLQEISIPMKPHLERSSKSPAARSLGGGSKPPACKCCFSSTRGLLTCSRTSGYPAVCWAGARGKCEGWRGAVNYDSRKPSPSIFQNSPPSNRKWMPRDVGYWPVVTQCVSGKAGKGPQVSI